MKLTIYYKSDIEIKEYFTFFDDCFLFDFILYQYILSNCFSSMTVSAKKYTQQIQYYISNHKTLDRFFDVKNFGEITVEPGVFINLNFLYNISADKLNNLIIYATESNKNIKFPGGEIIINPEFTFEEIFLEHIEFKNEEDIRMGKIKYSQWKYEDYEQ